MWRSSTDCPGSRAGRAPGRTRGLSTNAEYSTTTSRSDEEQPGSSTPPSGRRAESSTSTCGSGSSGFEPGTPPHHSARLAGIQRHRDCYTDCCTVMKSPPLARPTGALGRRLRRTYRSRRRIGCSPTTTRVQRYSVLRRVGRELQQVEHGAGGVRAVAEGGAAWGTERKADLIHVRGGEAEVVSVRSNQTAALCAIQIEPVRRGERHRQRRAVRSEGVQVSERDAHVGPPHLVRVEPGLERCLRPEYELGGEVEPDRRRSGGAAGVTVGTEQVARGWTRDRDGRRHGLAEQVPLLRVPGGGRRQQGLIGVQIEGERGDGAAVRVGSDLRV